MSKNVPDTLIEVSPGEIRAARLDEEGNLLDLTIERIHEKTLVGGIYAGRIKRIEKGMDAAFVDIGLEELALLNKAKGLSEGENLIVQITRDARDGKGPGVTKNPSLLDRYLAYMPGRRGLNWARAVGKGRDRARLEDFMSEFLDGREGYSVRGAAVAASGGALKSAIDKLEQRWEELQAAHKADSSPRCLEEPMGLIARLMRDAGAGARFAIDDRQAYLAAERDAKSTMTDLVDGLLFYKGKEPLFEEEEVDDQIDSALNRTMFIPGGGTLVFDSTEAMTVVDVNMADGGKHGDDAIFQVNRRAAEMVARQVMLRNISGLIVIDFISMKNKGRAKKLTEILRGLFRDDTRHTDVLGLTAAGLMEITRQREGKSLEAQLLLPRYPVIEPRAEAQACAVLRHALRLTGAGKPTAYASQPVIDVLTGPLAEGLAETSRRLGQDLILKEGEDLVPPQVEME